MNRSAAWRAVRGAGLGGLVYGSMPPDRYAMIHRGARLTDAEAERLVAGLRVLDDERRGGNGDQDDDAGAGGGRGSDDEDGDD